MHSTPHQNQTIDVVARTQTMIDHQLIQNKSEAEISGWPQRFKDYEIGKRVGQIFQYFKLVKIIPNEVTVENSYYNLEFVPKYVSDSSESSSSSISERQSSYWSQNLVVAILKRNYRASVMTDYNQTILDIFSLIPEESRDLSLYYIKLSILWKQYRFYIVNKKKPLELVKSSKENFNIIFKRALAIYPQLREKLKKLVQTQGQYKKVRLFKRQRISSNNGYKYEGPNAKLCFDEDVYFLSRSKK